MANALYTSAKSAFLKADMDLEALDIRVILIDVADYTYSAAHDFLDDVPSGARVATAALSGEVVNADATFECTSPITFTTVTGDPSEALIFYTHTGSDATARLIAYIDTVDDGLPVTPNGGDIAITIVDFIFGL